MGRPGPAPKLAETRALEGGTGGNGVISHRAVPPVITLAPKLDATHIPEPPDDIPEEGKQLWRDVVPFLAEVNVVQEIDLPAVKAMCVAYAQMERARRVLDEQGYFALGSTGQMTEHPAKRIHDTSSALWLRYAQEFGLTTMARTRLGLLDVQRKSIQQEMDWTLGPSTRKRDVA